MFTLEANSRIGSAKTPLLNIDFQNGQRFNPPDKRPPGSLPLDSPPPLAKASLTEGEAVSPMGCHHRHLASPAEWVLSDG